MFKANIKFHDGSVLNGVYLYKEQTLWTSMIIHKDEAEKLLSQWNTIYFSNDGIQGGFIPQHVETYELCDISEEELNSYVNQKVLSLIEEENKAKKPLLASKTSTNPNRKEMYVADMSNSKIHEKNMEMIKRLSKRM